VANGSDSFPGLFLTLVALTHSRCNLRPGIRAISLQTKAFRVDRHGFFATGPTWILETDKSFGVSGMEPITPAQPAPGMSQSPKREEEPSLSSWFYDLGMRDTRALRPACSLEPEGSARAQRTFDRLDAALAHFLEEVKLAA
jgi:hypothetical protein